MTRVRRVCGRGWHFGGWGLPEQLVPLPLPRERVKALALALERARVRLAARASMVVMWVGFGVQVKV